MPLTSRLFPDDEELGKRDDEYRPGAKPSRSARWQQHRRTPNFSSLAPRSIKRIALVLAGLIFFYYFFKFMPTDNERPQMRPHYVHPDTDAPLETPSATPIAPIASIAPDPIHSFNGPIKFYNLAVTLHLVQATQQNVRNTKNVLFAASSLKSASTLIPMACEMASWGRNKVHFALMGRDTIKMDTLKSINGVDKYCEVLFHDARPDYSEESSDFRMEVSSGAALGHINNFMHTSAIIVDGSSHEASFFLPAMRERSKALQRTLIELPPNSERSLLWLTRLDGEALSAWHKVSVDIVVHAPPESSGSLVRLLKSLSGADYFNSAPPRLTIELPQKVDPVTSQFLETFTWPPTAPDARTQFSQLSLHHRIPQYGLTPEENAIRFVESFWPANKKTSHVLVLSAQAEVSPLYYHYLKYSILEYRLSPGNEVTSKSLLGISLDLPTTYLNDTTKFAPPTYGDGEIDTFSPFLWEAPNSNAILIFGEVWAELHSLVSQLYAAKHVLPTPTTLNKKLVSKTFPSWLEELLQLARVRGYLTLYPNVEQTSSIVTIHNEMYQPPEEFATDDDDLYAMDLSDELSADPAEFLSLSHKEMPLHQGTLTNILAPDHLPLQLKSLPVLTWQGVPADKDYIDLASAEYAAVFARELGGCKPDAPTKARVVGSALDLFCTGDERRGGGSYGSQALDDSDDVAATMAGKKGGAADDVADGKGAGKKAAEKAGAATPKTAPVPVTAGAAAAAAAVAASVAAPAAVSDVAEEHLEIPSVPGAPAGPAKKATATSLATPTVPGAPPPGGRTRVENPRVEDLSAREAPDAPLADVSAQ